MCGQIHGADHAAAAEDHQPLEHALQLANVAGPVVLPEMQQRFGLHLTPMDAVTAAVDRKKVLHQQRDVRPPLAERRQHQLDGMQVTQ